MTMLRDGVKGIEKEQEIQVLDIAEITARANGL
jgi:heterodisulfide reductase subunit D